MRERMVCMLDRLPGLFLAGAFMLYHLPLLVVIRDVEVFSTGGGRLIALFVVGLDFAVAGGIALVLQSMGMRIRLRDLFQMLALIPLSFGLYAFPPDLTKVWLLVYALYTWSLSRLDRLSPVLSLSALMALSFQMALQNLESPLSHTLRDFGWLAGSVLLGELLGCTGSVPPGTHIPGREA